jgi:hypothetical protein
VTGRGGWVATDPNSRATGELAWHLLFLVGFTAPAVGLVLLGHDRSLLTSPSPFPARVRLPSDNSRPARNARVFQPPAG